MRTRWFAAILLVTLAVVSMAAAQTAQAPAQAAPAQMDYEAVARGILADLQAKRYDKVTALYSPELAQALPADKLAASWNGVESQVGALKSITDVHSEDAGGYHIVFLTCEFERLALIFRIGFNAKGQFAVFNSVPADTAAGWKAPDYAKPELFDERAITVHTGHWNLPGMLTVPKGAGPFPAIVLVHGSGPKDMDEGVGGNKMIKDLAWGLASRGIAVLRYTKRSRQYGAQAVDDINVFTIKDETIDDARSAVAMLATMPEINSKRIYVAGHSLGAYAAPRIADGDPQIAGIIVMAGNTRPLEVLIVEQIRYIESMNGDITPEGQKAIDQAEASAREMSNPDLKPGMTVHMLGIPLPASYVLDMRAYHPAEFAAKLKIPMLILQGQRDYNVSMLDFEGWKKGLAGHTNVTFKTYPAVNHDFLLGTGPSGPADDIRPSHVELDVVEDIAAWVKGLSAK